MSNAPAAHEGHTIDAILPAARGHLEAFRLPVTAIRLMMAAVLAIASAKSLL